MACITRMVACAAQRLGGSAVGTRHIRNGAVDLLIEINEAGLYVLPSAAYHC
jgi:hypothetical protein